MLGLKRKCWVSRGNVGSPEKMLGLQKIHMSVFDEKLEVSNENLGVLEKNFGNSNENLGVSEGKL